MNRLFSCSLGLIALGFVVSLVAAGCSSAPKTEAKKATPAKSIAAAPVAKEKAKSAPAADAGSKTMAKNAEGETPLVTCVYGSTKREIAITKKDDGCAVTYSKDGNTSEIASGSATSSKCTDVQSTVRGNLEKAGYTCK